MILLENENEEILLGKRAKDPGAGLWDTPGGFMEIGESAEECAKREVFEETEIVLDSLLYCGSQPSIYPFEEMRYELINFVFHTRIDSGQKMNAKDDVLELKFFPKNNLPFEIINDPELLRKIIISLNQSQEKSIS